MKSAAENKTKVISQTVEFFIFLLLWFAFLIYAWGKYPQYYVAWNIDLGREIMVPLRILSGEIPIKDFHLLYPAFSYYLNAGFLYFFGTSLNHFFFLGAFQSVIYLFLVQIFLQRSAIEKWPRRLITLVFITCCLFPGENEGRFLFPYYFGYSYSLIFSLIVILFIDTYLKNNRRSFLFGAGMFTGLMVISKQDFLPCAVLAITLGLLFETFRDPPNQRFRPVISLLVVLLGVALPVAVFNGFLLQQGVSFRQLGENWFQPEIRFQLYSRFPLWVYYHFPVKRFILFGIILFLFLGGSYLINDHKRKFWGTLLIVGLFSLTLRQIVLDSIQFDFRSWTAILSLAYGFIHLLKLKESFAEGDYLLPLFAVASLGIQVRPFLSHGVFAAYWEGMLNYFLLLGSLLFLLDLGKRFSSLNKRVFSLGFSVILISVIFSASLHLLAYFQPNRWKAVSTHLGQLFLPKKPLEEKAFSEAYHFVKALSKSQKILAVDGDLLLASAGRLSRLPASQASNQLTPALEKKVIQELFQNKTDYVFLIQDGNFYPSILGFLYGFDLYQFLLRHYQTERMWGGDVPFEQFIALKNSETMIYILKKRMDDKH